MTSSSFSFYFLVLLLCTVLPESALAQSRSTKSLFIYESTGLPYRMILSQTQLTNPNWNFVDNLVVFLNGSTSGSVEMVYAEDNTTNIQRGIIIPAGAALDGWTKQWSFWVLPKENWCSCKVYISQTGFEICTGGPASITASRPSLTDPLLNKQDPIPVYGFKCNTTNQCKCTYTSSQWANLFAAYSAKNNNQCRWPQLSSKVPGYSYWITPNYYGSGGLTETLKILIISNWVSVMGSGLTTNTYKFAQEYIAAILNFANGACNDCSADPALSTYCSQLSIKLEAATPYTARAAIDDTLWQSTINNYYTDFLRFNQGSFLSSCGPNTFNDQVVGGGCCSQCLRPLPYGDDDDANNLIRSSYQIAGQSAPSSNGGNYHRMSLSFRSYSPLSDWCPRLSFWSPCPEWDSVHYNSKGDSSDGSK